MAYVCISSFCNISTDLSDQHNGPFFERTPTCEPTCRVQMQCRVPEAATDNIYGHNTSYEPIQLGISGLRHTMYHHG